jgi:hypothetical protein
VQHHEGEVKLSAVHTSTLHRRGTR